ncbi:MAG: hypothetical protein K8H75_18790 [Sulfuricella sp.]|nr:hypothetical protein [Sulfuricella sp.]
MNGFKSNMPGQRSIFIRRFGSRLSLVSPWLALVLALVPYAYSGFYFDDVFNSSVKGWSIFNGQSVWQLVIQQLRVWLLENGRFFPLAIITGYPIWEINDTLVKYRIMHLAFILANAFVLYRLLVGLTQNRWLPSLVLLCVPMVFQFNPRWDPITSFGPLNQLVLLLVLAAWLFLQNFFSTGRRHFMVMALLTQFLALCTYEVALVVLPGMLAIALAYRTAKPIESRRAILLSMAVASVYLLIYLAFSMLRTSVYDGVYIEKYSIIPTFAAQFASAFPLAFLHNNLLQISYPKGGVLVFFLGYFLTAAAAVALKKYDISKEKYSSRREHEWIIWALAACLMLVPSLLVAISGRYQRIVTYGDPYIIVYMQYWGVAIVMALGLQRLLQAAALRRGWVVGVVVLVALVSAITSSANLGRIKDVNGDFLEPRVRMERLIEQGFLDSLPPNSNLVVDSPYLWESADETICSSFFSLWAKRPVHCIPADLIAKGYDMTKWDPATTYVLRRIKGVDLPDGVELLGERNKIVARFTEQGSNIVRKNLEGSGLVLGPMLGEGFYGWEPTGEKQWAWSNGNAELLFYNLTRQAQLVKLHMSLQSPINRNIKGRVGGVVVFDVSVSSVEDKSVDLEFEISPGRSALSITTAEPPVKLSQTDTRDFSFRIMGVVVE